MKRLTPILTAACWICMAGSWQLAVAQTGPVALATTVTNASQVRRLAQSEAAKHLPVRLRGVVIGEAETGGDGFAVQDGTSGIYCRATSNVVEKLHPGDFVEVQGETDPGEFAPFVVVTQLKVLGKKPVPEPRHVTFEEMLGGGLDAQWVEISGIVRYCEPSPNAPQRCRLELSTGGGRLVVRLNTSRAEGAPVDAQVRLRGVCYYLVNRNRQPLSPLLAVPHDTPVVIETPAPADPFSTPVQRVGNLLQFAPEGSYGRRAHVRGVVTRYQPGEYLFIRDEAFGLRIRTSQRAALNLGDEVDVLGFPKQGEYSVVLEDALFRRRGPGTQPMPVRLAQPKDAFDHDADLMALDAMLGERQVLAYGWAYELRAEDGTAFTAMLRSSSGPPPQWQLGSLVHILGVCSVTRDYSGYASGLSRPQSFQLLLRTAADMTLIKPPPWWTYERTLWLLCAIAGCAVLSVAGVLLAARSRLREQAARRAMAEVEFHAILAERNRLAREIHDVLAQGLNAIFLHLDLVKDQIKSLPEGAAKHLQVARELARKSIVDARDAVWNLRSQVLENGDLVSAVKGVLKQLASDVEASCTVTGTPRRLSPEVENALLRIGQEAITNAMKHARAEHIQVEIEFAERQVKLSVKDDGCGFDPGQASPRAGRFGLVGMHERSQQLGGELIVRSEIGKGSEITVVVPVSFA